QKDGFSYVTNKQDMLKDKNTKMLGLFAPGGMPKMMDRDATMPSLRDMTNTAINKLVKDKDGFFLMVEGSQIDWAGHDNDIVAAMSE
ncbi:alkaline phosphatase, partial [Pseudomonas sp. FW305-BF6]|uniref:alkaline phosphatase n=1 Tax=Pseudomonas sp. FW305-BF6 TaxID=2070673 RepID=UPI000CC3C9B9